MRRVRLGPGPEFDLVRELLRAAGEGSAAPEVELGPGDDAAVLSPPAGEKVVLSTDISVEDVHFRRAWMRWRTVGFRAAAASLSDLAAMAARPLGVLLSVALPPELDREVLAELGEGVGECLSQHGGVLLGGDLSRSPGPVVVDVAAVGAARRPVGRGGARPGDELWITGRLGGAGAAVADLRRGLEPDPRARRAFLRPRPRVAEARWLAERGDVTALVDLSDGLAGDATHMAAASGVRLVVELARLPLAAVLEEFDDRDVARGFAVGRGEDYELLAAAPPDILEGRVGEFRRAFGAPLTRVGRVDEGEGVAWLDSSGREVGVPEGHDHFRA